jgi:hypothetical protein
MPFIGSSRLVARACVILAVTSEESKERLDPLRKSLGSMGIDLLLRFAYRFGVLPANLPEGNRFGGVRYDASSDTRERFYGVSFAHRRCRRRPIMSRFRRLKVSQGARGASRRL